MTESESVITDKTTVECESTDNDVFGIYSVVKYYVEV